MKEKMETGTDLFRTEKIPKILLKIAPPVMLAQLIQAVYNIVDSFFVGQYSANSLTALSVIYPLQLIIIALAVGTGVGVNTYMARQYAQKCAGAEFQLRDEELWEMPGDHEGQLSVFLWVYADRGGCFVFFPVELLRIFSDSSEVIAIGKTAFPISEVLVGVTGMGVYWRTINGWKNSRK